MRRLRRAAEFVACVVLGLLRNPPLALRLLASLRLRDRKTWRRFALAIHGADFIADLYAASREAGIRPFLMWGTLLGAIRDQGFVAGDADIDIGVLSADYARRDALAGAMAARGYRLDRDIPYKLRFARPALHMDIDVFYALGERAICSAPDGRGGLVGAAFPRHLLTRLRPHRFSGTDVLVPADAEAVLAHIYGRWEVPDPGYSSQTDLGNRLAFAPGETPPPFAGLPEER